jgi:hypothetical protein
MHFVHEQEIKSCRVGDKHKHKRQFNVQFDTPPVPPQLCHCDRLTVMAAHTSWPYKRATPAGHTGWPPPAIAGTCGCIVCHSAQSDVLTWTCRRLRLWRKGGRHAPMPSSSGSLGGSTNESSSLNTSRVSPSIRPCIRLASPLCQQALLSSAWTSSMHSSHRVASSLTHHSHTHTHTHTTFASRFQRLQAHTPFRSPHATNER